MPLISMKTTGAFANESSDGEKLMNVSYGTAPGQQMDIYLPANRNVSTTHSIILIHGGAWSSGSRKTFNHHVDSFLNRLPGYAIFNVDYRLVTSVTLFPAQENDIKAAVDFISANAERYQINRDKLILLGVSAGGHLALLQAYKNNTPKVAAVIDFFGPSDLEIMYKKPWHPMIPFLLQNLLGGSPETSMQAYRNASPVNFISTTSPPTLIFHGRKDRTVNISQSELLQKKLQATGIKNKLVVYDRAAHGWYGALLSDSYDKIESFLKSLL